jgi:hypothetical protein
MRWNHTTVDTMISIFNGYPDNVKFVNEKEYPVRDTSASIFVARTRSSAGISSNRCNCEDGESTFGRVTDGSSRGWKSCVHKCRWELV